jgi:nitrite reductase/ring-hydroxylating ferredoxin subunit
VSRRFDLADGEALDSPAELPPARYDVVIEGGRVFIDIPEESLGVNE